MCPNNRIGVVDVLLGLHHGVSSSNSEGMVHALHPRVAIMNNGTRKGGEPEVMKTVHSSPGLEDLWQLHFSLLSGQEYTVPGMFIANTIDDQPPTMPIAPTPAPQLGPGAPPAPVHNGKAYWIKVSAHNRMVPLQLALTRGTASVRPTEPCYSFKNWSLEAAFETTVAKVGPGAYRGPNHRCSRAIEAPHQALVLRAVPSSHLTSVPSLPGRSCRIWARK